MPAEYTYFILFVLVTTFALLSLWRIVRAAKGAIRQLNYESRRDRLQHERIARERHFQSRALRRSTRKVNGRTHVGWDQSDRRAQRDYHIDEAAHEVFDPVANVRGMDVRTPWGWPGARSRRRQRAGSDIRSTISDFFRPKKVVDHQVRAQREQAIRALVEDRYGRIRHSAPATEIEWSRPQLPPEYLKERENDQVLAWKVSQEAADKAEKIQAIRLVASNTQPSSAQRRASGE